VVRTSSGDRPPRDRPMLELPLAHRDRTVGRFIVAQRSPNERWHAADRRLLDAIATQVGPVADAARLTSDLRLSREQLVRAREEERRRIRRDLHDGLGPSLAAHTLGLDAVIDALEDDPSTVTARVEALKRDTQDLITDVRRLVHELRPPALDELGLIGALVAHVAVLDESGALAVRIRAEPDPLPQLSAAVEVAAYRIVAEAVTNTLRHARAASCTVRIELVEPPEEGTAMLRLEVRDDGRGLPIVTRPGIGLTSMRERAEELGGMVTVTDAEDVGTVVAASLPCEVVAADVPLVPGTEVTHD
jgi:two-component system NarL family sensor kinase